MADRLHRWRDQPTPYLIAAGVLSCASIVGGLFIDPGSFVTNLLAGFVGMVVAILAGVFVVDRLVLIDRRRRLAATRRWVAVSGRFLIEDVALQFLKTLGISDPDVEAELLGPLERGEGGPLDAEDAVSEIAMLMETDAYGVSRRAVGDTSRHGPSAPTATSAGLYRAVLPLLDRLNYQVGPQLLVLDEPRLVADLLRPQERELAWHRSLLFADGGSESPEATWEWASEFLSHAAPVYRRFRELGRFWDENPQVEIRRDEK